jgi:hypothetical protein
MHSVHSLSKADFEARGKTFGDAQRLVEAAGWAIAQIDPDSEVARTAPSELIDDSTTEESTKLLLNRTLQRLGAAAQARAQGIDY